MYMKYILKFSFLEFLRHTYFSVKSIEHRNFLSEKTRLHAFSQLFGLLIAPNDPSLALKVSAKSVDNVACLLLHEKFEQTRDGKFLRFIIIIAPPQNRVSTWEKSLIIHECCRVEKENIFSPLSADIFPPISIFPFL